MIMKKLYFQIIAILIITHFNSNAQFYGGATVGLVVTDAKADASISILDSELQSRTSFNYGLMAEYFFANNFSLRSKLLFTNRGFQYQQNTNLDVFGIDIPIGAKAELDINQIEVPLLIQYNYGLKNIDLFINAGPSISYTTAAKLRTKATLLFDFNVSETDISLDADYIDRTDFNLNIGLGMAINTDSGRFLAEGSFGHALNSTIGETFIDTELRNKFFSFNVGYEYRF